MQKKRSTKSLFSPLVFMLLATGCGGGGGGNNSDALGSYEPVPATVEYREGGVIKGMQIFDYGTNSTVRSRFVVDSGNDGQWNTADDVRKGGLTCKYQQSDNPLPPALLSVVQNMGTNGDGSFALQQLDLESDGRISICPTLSGKQLVKEEVLCEDNFCPARYQFGYSITIEQKEQEGGWSQTQHTIFYDGNGLMITAPPFPSHIQTTNLSGDTESGFEFLVTVEPSPEYSEDASLAQAFLYAGNGYQEKVVQWLPGELESRVVMDRYGENESYVDTRYRTMTWLPEKGELQDSQDSQNPPALYPLMRVYEFDENGKPASQVALMAGEDNIWFTADDVVYGFPEFIYDEDGFLKEMKTIEGNAARSFDYDDNGRVTDINVFGEKRREYRYQNAKLRTLNLMSFDAEKGIIEQRVTFRDDVPGVVTFIPDQRFARDESGRLVDPLVPQDKEQIKLLGRPF